MSIEITGMAIKTVPIKAQELQFDMSGKKTKYTDANGAEVRKVQVSASEYKWMYVKSGKEMAEGKAYKNINGTPVASFKKTQVIKSYDQINKLDVKYFINNELTYLLINDAFKTKIKRMDKLGKAISFKYVHSGFKIHTAVISYDTSLDKVFMRCYRGDLRKVELNDSIEDNKEVTENDDGVKPLNLAEVEI